MYSKETFNYCTLQKNDRQTNFTWTMLIFTNKFLSYVLGVFQKSRAECTDGEFNKIVYNKKKTVTAWKHDTYRVRNHFVTNPTNSKFIRLKNNSKNIFLLQQNLEKVRTNKKNLWCSTENFNLTAASQLVSWSNTSTLFNYFVKKVVTS